MIDFDKFPYSQIRPLQQKVLDAMDKNWDDYKYYICELPTGTGKSAIAKTVSSSVDKAFIITSTKQLQDQYVNDFNDGSIISIKGKANYQCALNKKLNCECGYCIADKGILKNCKETGKCPYYSLRKKALESNITLTSYQYFLRAVDCAGFWKPRNVLIFDECHLLENQLVQWASIKLSPRELIEKYDISSNCNLQDFFAITICPEKPGYANNEKWIKTLTRIIFNKRNEKFQEMQESLDLSTDDPNNLSPEDLNLILATHKEYYDLDKLYTKLDVFIKEDNKEDWIIELYEDGLELTPINIQKIFHNYIRPIGFEKIIFMSATILDLPKFRRTFGMSKQQTLMIRTDTEFKSNRSPIVYNPICKMNYDSLNQNLSTIADSIKEILEKHPNEKGIIHTGNSVISKYLETHLNNERLLIRYGDVNNLQIIEKHLTSKSPTVLVSSSLSEGVDLKDDLSRFQIIVKLPFLSLADKRIFVKARRDKDWYTIQMLKSLIQQCGRSTRNSNDYCLTYVLDSSFKWWIRHHQKKGWFQPRFINRIIWNKYDFDYNAYKDVTSITN